MAEFTINSHKYRSARLDARRQLHTARRFSKVIMASIAVAMARKELDPSVQLAPLADAITAMTNVDFDYVLDNCLSVTARQGTGGGWAPLASGGTIMFDDMDGLELVGIMVEVLTENLANFFSGLRSILPQTATVPEAETSSGSPEAKIS